MYFVIPRLNTLMDGDAKPMSVVKGKKRCFFVILTLMIEIRINYKSHQLCHRHFYGFITLKLKLLVDNRKDVQTMLYELQQDFEIIFYFTRIVLLWVLFHKGILWISRNDLSSFNMMCGILYLTFLYHDMDSFRITTIMTLFVINSLHLLSK